MHKKQSMIKGKWELILHDDSKLSFDHVMNCLVEICGHNEYQASQCALITHNTKSCSIFVDKHNDCIIVKNNLISAGLTVTIQKQKRNV